MLLLFFLALYLTFNIYEILFSGYARPLVDRIDVENKFKLRLYRPATVST
jgi:hypothetical protein